MSAFNHRYKLKVEALGKSFTLHNRGGVRVQGFENVNFSLRCGELLALHGPSGADKSSILKTIFRTYLADSGSIRFHRNNNPEVDLASCPESHVLDLRRREIGFVTQFLKILPRVSALDAVAYPLIEIGTDEEQAKEEARKMLTQLGIREELFKLSPLTFSGGEQQRVNIARGIIAPKELILLDEPTASLDQKSSEVVLRLLDQLKQRNIAMIAIFHDQRKIEQIADVAVAIGRNEI